MRIEATIWTGTAAFYLFIVVVYLAVSGDPAGTVLLLMGVGFGALVAGWLWIASGITGQRAEDRADADMADEAGPVGVFVTSSLQPFWLALAIVASTLGLIFGLWITAIGIGFGLVTVTSLAIPRSE